MSHKFIISESDIRSVRFEWTINLDSQPMLSQQYSEMGYYSQATQIDNTITSETFSIKGLREPVKWQLILTVLPFDISSPRYQELQYNARGEYKRDFKIGLKCLNLNRLNLKVTFSPHFRNHARNAYFDFKISHLFSNSSMSVFSKCLVVPSINYGLLCNGNVIPFSTAQMIIYGNISIIEEKDESLLTKAESLNVSHLQRDLKIALLNKQFADVTFKVKDITLHAHKIILASRSPVFQKMFEHDMKENCSNIITIVDVEKPELENFLLFLYTGILEDRKLDTLRSLYSMADKYEVESLQTTCREQLISHLSVKTVPSILKLAHMHNDSNLKTIAIKFISDYFAEVESTEPWKLVLDTDPHLASETLRYVSTHMVKK